MSDRGPPLYVRIPNWLGDLVLAWPVVEAAAAREAVFAGPAVFEPLFTVRFPQSRYLTWSRTRRYAIAKELRALRPGAALLLTDSLSSALLAFLAGIPRRIGYAAEARGVLLTVRVPRAGEARTAPRTSEYRTLAEAAGLHTDPGEPRWTATEVDHAAADERLEKAGVSGRIAALAPGAAYGPAKQWGPERFAVVGAHLTLRHDASIAIVGAAADRDAAAETAKLATAAGARAIDLAGQTTLSELIGLLARSIAVASNDSGVMHAAAALGRPTLAVFGSTSPVWTSSAAPWVENLYAEYPCSPCFRRTCPIGYGCLRSIEAEAGSRAIDRLLALERRAHEAREIA